MGWLADRIGIRGTVICRRRHDRGRPRACRRSGTVWALYRAGLFIGPARQRRDVPAAPHLCQPLVRPAARRRARPHRVRPIYRRHDVAEPVRDGDGALRLAGDDDRLCRVVLSRHPADRVSSCARRPGIRSPPRARASARTRRGAGPAAERGARRCCCLAGFCCCVPWRCRRAISSPSAAMSASGGAGAVMLSVLLACAFISRQFWGWLADRVGGLRDADRSARPARRWRSAPSC